MSVKEKEKKRKMNKMCIYNKDNKQCVLSVVRGKFCKSHLALKNIDFEANRELARVARSLFLRREYKEAMEAYRNLVSRRSVFEQRYSWNTQQLNFEAEARITACLAAIERGEHWVPPTGCKALHQHEVEGKFGHLDLAYRTVEKFTIICSLYTDSMSTLRRDCLPSGMDNIQSYIWKKQDVVPVEAYAYLDLNWQSLARTHKWL